MLHGISKRSFAERRRSNSGWMELAFPSALHHAGRGILAAALLIAGTHQALCAAADATQSTIQRGVSAPTAGQAAKRTSSGSQRKPIVSPYARAAASGAAGRQSVAAARGPTTLQAAGKPSRPRRPGRP
jgi:hypothetical protein